MESDLDAAAEQLEAAARHWREARTWEAVSGEVEAVREVTSRIPNPFPAGAAVLLLDVGQLHAIFNLPDDIEVHHTFLAPLHYGNAIGLQLISQTPGRLPPIERNCELPKVYGRATQCEDADGTVYYRLSLDLPDMQGKQP